MLLVPYIRENTQHVIDRLTARNFDAANLVDEVLNLDQQRKNIQAQTDEILAKSNKLSKEIGELFRSGKKDEANQLKEQTKELKESSHQLKDKLGEVEEKLREVLLQIPNVPHQSVPTGRDEEDNEIILENGSTPELHEGKLPHWELAEKYDLIDFDLGSKITGAGFPVYKGKGARLQRALINFFLDEARDAGYNEVIPPLLVNEDSGMGTGQLPDKEGQMYHTAADNLYLIPTAEVPITNIYRDVILKPEDFPVKVCGYTPCFRREAGSYGKDVRGLNRLHQFDKVEIVQIVHPEKSYQTLDDMVTHVTGLLEKLGLQYRIARLCGGDLGFTSALTYDMEVYSAAQERWLEVSSVSNFETFQANRLKCRFKDENGKSQLVHTLNGSALALPRIVASLLENFQTPEGIKVPEPLVAYTGFDMID